MTGGLASCTDAARRCRLKAIVVVVVDVVVVVVVVGVVVVNAGGATFDGVTDDRDSTPLFLRCSQT